MHKTILCSTICAAAFAFAAPALAANSAAKAYREGGAPTVTTAGLPANASRRNFPNLTTIYIGSGVRDNGGDANAGIASHFHCSNVSGASAQVRFLVLGSSGAVAGNQTVSIPGGGTLTASTHADSTYIEDILLNTTIVGQGLVNIESTTSAVFCSASVTNGAVGGNGIGLALTRVNPHPGTAQ